MCYQAALRPDRSRALYAQPRRDASGSWGTFAAVDAKSLSRSFFVIPAKSGDSSRDRATRGTLGRWVPAFAGMTEGWTGRIQKFIFVNRLSRLASPALMRAMKMLRRLGLPLALFATPPRPQEPRGGKACIRTVSTR